MSHALASMYILTDFVLFAPWLNHCFDSYVCWHGWKGRNTAFRNTIRLGGFCPHSLIYDISCLVVYDAIGGAQSAGGWHAAVIGDDVNVF